MRLLALSRFHNYYRGVNHIYNGRPRWAFWTPSTRRAISSIASRLSPTSLRYHDEPIRFDDQQGNAGLVGLVEQARYGEAYRLRLHLLDSGVEIQPHAIYEKAAVSALGWRDQVKCLEEFSTWFSLVPEMDEAVSTRSVPPFRNIRNALLRSGIPAQRLPIIYRFGTMCASKGYTEPMFGEVVRFVVRYATAREGVRAMLDIEDAAKDYQLRHHPESVLATAQKFRAMAVEICVQVGWIAIAAKLTQFERDFTLPDRTYEFLLQHLEGPSWKPHRSLVTKLRLDDSLRDTSPSFRHAKFSPFKSQATTSGSLPVIHSERQRAYMESLGPQLKDLDYPEGVEQVGDRNIPQPSDDTLALGGSEPASENSSDNTHRRYEEMISHYMRREYAQVISIFSAHYRRSTYLDPVFSHTLDRILAPLPRYPDAARQFPLSDNSQWIILRTIITLATLLPWPLATIESLYASFITIPSFQGSTKVSSTFIWAFGECGRVDLARSALDDTRVEGRVLDGRCLDMMAGVYARNNMVDQAMGILDEIERSGPGEREVAIRITRPTRFTTYGRIIQGFVDAGLLEPALVVERRMKAKLPYQKGKHRKLEVTLDALRVLQAEKAPEG